MCPRRINGGQLNPGIILDEIVLDTFTQWFDIEFVKQLDRLNMCGNLGDPIVAKDTLEIFQYLRKHNPAMYLQMHTNGSAKTVQWWKDLAEQRVTVVFGIDGLSDTHSKYRINTDWNKIIENAQAFISNGGDARWDMIVFKHNEHQVEECKALSERLGFKEFSIKHTSRFKDGKFDVLDDNGNIIDVLYPTSKSESMISKVKKAQEEILPTINCKAVNQSELYISATGTVSPCCWLDMEWLPEQSFSKNDYIEKINEYPNLNSKTLKEIFSSGYFTKISNCWTTTGLRECSKQCGSFDRLNEQFIRIKHAS
jgi:MoaA/NifB/PqqE/SkfB family radical SAM enzyme